ncbi:hypothetical protein [Candidatus Palauibacter sp.]|uniref:hypothetical protein n=1 Tax=Candidatus Palauibacter sp. TaxID=3101350 RepID=UPI003B52952D
MKTNATTTAVAALLALALAACGDATPPPDVTPFEAPEVTAALDWIEDSGMEFGAAPFSPPGWPYRIGERITTYHPSDPRNATSPLPTRSQLLKRFPDFLGIFAVNWVDGLAFGAKFSAGGGEFRIYEGHFPQKITRTSYEDAQRFGIALPMPPGGNVEKALGDHIEAAYPVASDSLDVLRARWHEPLEVRTYKDGGR